MWLVLLLFVPTLSPGFASHFATVMAAPATITAEQFAHFAEKDKYNVVEIVAFLRATVPQLPDVGVICGSGLSELHTILADRVTIAYKDIPGFPLSTVQGQVGELIFGTLGATNVVLMRGRFHFYEGYEPAKVALPVRVMAALGVRAIVVTNASGGVNPSFNIGDFMVIKDHMSFPGLSGVSPLVCAPFVHACVYLVCVYEVGVHARPCFMP